MEKQIDSLIKWTIYPAMCEDVAPDVADRKMAWDLLIAKIQELAIKDLEECQ